ncbi:MAG: STAS domain-containing protein [Planctomycetota bacterium]|nr:STAS domain-containing protein [Planctomycetota bacterium]
MPATVDRHELGVERGPGWLFIKLDNIITDPFEDDLLDEQIWSLLEKHFTYRVVLEMDEVEVVGSQLVSQLLRLCRKIHRHGGIIRLSGLSPQNQEVLKACSLSDRFPECRDRVEAVMGCKSCK